MYKIYADDTLIYDSTVEDYRIGKGVVTLETNKSGSFVFSLYPDHFFYDKFIRLKTVIKVLKDNKIVFRGRVLNDVSDYWNNKVLTCEGELGFLQDSIIRPFTFSGTPEDLFKKLIQEHNAQVDNFKKFKIGSVTVKDPNDYIVRSNSEYETALSNLDSRLIKDSTGGYFYITHDEEDDIPTIHYLADFTKISAQVIEFGSNLKDYTKKVSAEDIATELIPLGAQIGEGDNTHRLTISAVNGGKDYLKNDTAIALYGLITKVETWDDVTVDTILKSKGEARLAEIIKQNTTIELNAIDLHLLDKSIESFNVCEYVRVISAPHNFDSVLLCNKQTLDLLKPNNDSLVLGYTYSTFTETSNKVSNSITTISTMSSSLSNVNNQVHKAQADASQALKDFNKVSEDLTEITGDLEAVAGAVVENARNISTNAGNISQNTTDISQLQTDVEALNTDIEDLNKKVDEDIKTLKESLTDPLTDKNTSISDIIARLEALERTVV